MFNKVTLRAVPDSGHGHEAPLHHVEEPPPDLSEIERREDALILLLRKEAQEAYSDFTRYAFRALGSAAVAFGAILEFMFLSPFGGEGGGHEPARGLPILGFAALPVLFFVLMTLRMGTYAATLSNRLIGFELYVARIRDVPQSMRGRWKDGWRRIGYEEAMRAWRVVQDTLMRTVCRERNFLLPYRYSAGFRPSARNPIWFNQESLFGRCSSARWYEDSYLWVMQYLILVAALSAVAILWVTPFAISAFMPPHGSGRDFFSILMEGPRRRLALVVAAFVFAVLGTAGIIFSERNERARRRLLADGIQSIHSSAISWQAVIVAHFCALGRAQEMGLTSWQLAELTRRIPRSELKACRAGKVRFEELARKHGVKPDPAGIPDGAGYTGYSFWLAQEAESVARCAKDIPGWIGLGEEKLRTLGRIA